MLHGDTRRNHEDSQRLTINDLSGIIIGKAIEVHRELGPGLLESAYQECLYFELINEGLKVDSEKPLPLIYKDLKLDHGYRVDLLIEDRIVVELKTVEFLTDVHTAQILTYLKLTQCELGLLINFNVKMLKQGIKRYRL